MNIRTDLRVLVALFVIAVAVGAVGGYFVGVAGGHLVAWRS